MSISCAWYFSVGRIWLHFALLTVSRFQSLISIVILQTTVLLLFVFDGDSPGLRALLRTPQPPWLDLT